MEAVNAMGANRASGVQIQNPTLSSLHPLPRRPALALRLLQHLCFKQLPCRLGPVCGDGSASTSRERESDPVIPMDAVDEEQSRRLLQPTAENLANVKVFPLIPSLKKDVAVSHDAWELSWIQTREVIGRETSVRAVAVCIRITSH